MAFAMRAGSALNELSLCTVVINLQPFSDGGIVHGRAGRLRSHLDEKDSQNGNRRARKLSPRRSCKAGSAHRFIQPGGAGTSAVTPCSRRVVACGQGPPCEGRRRCSDRSTIHCACRRTLCAAEALAGGGRGRDGGLPRGIDHRRPVGRCGVLAPARSPVSPALQNTPPSHPRAVR
jgi:hypothetical protein